MGLLFLPPIAALVAYIVYRLALWSIGTPIEKFMSGDTYGNIGLVSGWVILIGIILTALELLIFLIGRVWYYASGPC